MSLMGIKGIVLEGVNAVNNQVYNNIFQQDPVAVNIASSSQNNNVSRNIISLSTTAIKIETSANTICANIMSKNQLGINITNSNDNVILHNTFADNTVQVSISNSAGNVWDDGYPSCGNYWSDHTGPDIFSGPNQDQPGSDGIVDTPYTVAIGSVDRYPLVRPFNAHDVGIMDYAVSKTVVGKGYTLSLEVKILNCGVYDENFLLTAYANTSTVAAQTVTLTKSNSIILTLTWNTSSFAYGNYTVNAQAEPVLNETNTADNILCCGTVYVGIPGDVNGDGGVDIYDAIVISNSFMSTSGSRKWNANANINGDNIVDIYDAIILANHYNQHYP
jgi:parallel beta-helix repeat protein